MIHSAPRLLLAALVTLGAGGLAAQAPATTEVTADQVIAGGMQAVGLARVFGETSMGGVLPAHWERLPNGDVLYHAVADFVTGDGVLLEGRGVIPDEPVAVGRRDLLAGRDPALEAAIRWIASARSARPEGDSR